MTDSAPGQGGTEQAEEQRRGLRMGRPFGIPVYVDPSWIIVAVVITVLFEPDAAEVVDAPASYIVAFTYAVLLYVSVFLHELGHSVVARLFGLPVRAITLHILGGVSEIEREPRTPGREFLIAFAGPLLSLVLAAVGIAVYQLDPFPPAGMLLVEALAAANLIVGIFNLLPGLPLDGGRIVRAGVWKITGRPSTGTIAAGWVGRGVAVVVVILGVALATYGDGRSLLSLVWTGLVASFIWVGASSAIKMTKIRERIPLLDARALARRPVLVEASVPLAEAIRRANVSEDGRVALVISDHEGHPVGLVNEEAVAAVPEQRRPWVEVGNLARTLEPGLELPADLAGEELIVALRSMPATEYLLREPTGELYGVLSTADVDAAFSGAG